MNSLPKETLHISAAIIRELDHSNKTKDEIFKNIAEINFITVDEVISTSKLIILLYQERIGRLE